MSRAVELANRIFVVLVVGAVIYGATLACAAARAGLSVAIIDKGDYGEGASANSLKILHGGLRYLQSMNVSRMRQSIWSRRDGFRQLPHLAHPAPFLAPIESKISRSRAAYKIAACINDLISHDRNDGMPPTHHIPRTRVINGDELKQLIPELAQCRRGALLWYDGLIENTERYTLAYVFSARDAGASIANYTKANGLRFKNGRACGVRAYSVEQDRAFDIEAKITVNTASAWRHDWTGLPPDAKHRQDWVRAINVVTPRRWFGDHGVGLSNGSRNLFFAPWRGGTMIGTMYDPFTLPADNCRVSPEDLSRLVDEVNIVYPEAGFTANDITLVHAGVLPARPLRSGKPSDTCEDRTFIWPGGENGKTPGYYVLQGVKYTTAAFWADKVTGMIATELGASKAPQVNVSLYSAPNGDEARLTARPWLTPESTAWLLANYGSAVTSVLRYADENPAWQAPIHGTLIPAACLVHAVKEEDARQPNDFILRRTDLGTARGPSHETVDAITQLMNDLKSDGY